MDNLAMQPQARAAHPTIPYIAAMTLLFAVLNYMGSALFHVADGVTTVKPFGGVALAILLIRGRSWLWPVLITGTLGAVFAKLAFDTATVESIVIPCVSSGALLSIYLLSQKIIGRTIDF